MRVGAMNVHQPDTRCMTEVDLATVLNEAKKLMSEALRLLDVVQAWEPSAHLDLAIQRLDAMLEDVPPRDE